MGVGGRSGLAASEGPAGELPSPLGGRRGAACRRTGPAGVPSTGGTPGPCKGLSPVSSGAAWLISRGTLWKQALGGGSCEARERPWAAVELCSELRRWERDGGGRLGAERSESRFKEQCGFWNFPETCGFESGTLKLYASAHSPQDCQRSLTGTCPGRDARLSGACPEPAPSAPRGQGAPRPRVTRARAGTGRRRSGATERDVFLLSITSGKALNPVSLLCDAVVAASETGFDVERRSGPVPGPPPEAAGDRILHECFISGENACAAHTGGERNGEFAMSSLRERFL